MNRVNLYILRITLLLAVGLCASGAQAQFGKNNNNNRIDDPFGKNNLLEQIPNYNEQEQDKNKDTTKKPPRIRKPLESFYFDDSLRQQRIFSWTVSLSNNDITRVVVDTLLPGFQIDYRFMRTDVGDAYLGNVGSASIPLNYFRRPEAVNFSFVDVWSPFIMTPEKVKFYNAKIPYSRLSYAMSGAVQFEESLFNFILSHNVSPSTTFNMEYNGDATKGEYMRQKTMDRYFTVNFAHTGKRYAIHAGYIYNTGSIDENGGIKDDRDITDTVISLPRNIPVRLTDANNTYKGHTFWLTQSYGIPLRHQKEDELTIQQIPTIYIGMTLEQTMFSKKYTAKGDTSLYKNSYISPDVSNDSISQSRFDLKFFAQLQPYNRNGILGLVTAGVGNESNTYYSTPTPEQYQPQYGTGGNMGRNTTYLYGAAEGSFQKYLKWGANARFNLLGYRAADLDVKGNIQATAYINKRPLTLDASIRFSLREPEFWTQNYFSNHFAWANSFTKESSTTFSARLSMPSIGLELGGDYQLVQNKFYYDQNSLAAQSVTPTSIIGVYLQKNFRAGGFRFNHRVLMQWSTQQEVAPVPAISAFVSYFYEFNVVKNVLRLELGVDGHYNTKYYGFGYNPAIAQFYNQREKQIGGYPFLDAFAAAKWKRMRILVKLQHFNANLIGESNYFTVLHHPSNRMMFKLGVSWSFYD